jgi:SAM-dependent methyltransferase
VESEFGVSNELESRILERQWFYPFKLPSGRVTEPYVPDHIAPVHSTRREMMFAALDPLYAGRWDGVRCLDLACNQGYFSMLLAQRGCAEVLGIEARQETVDEANLMRDCLGLARARYVQGDVMSMKGDEYEPFDVVLMLGLIYHLENPVGALRLARAMTRGVLLVESQVGPDCNAKIDWGTNTMQQQIQGTFSLIDETEQFANPLGSVTGIALCPSPAAIVWILKALGFPRVEILPAPENGYEQFTSGNRVMVAAYTAESA